MSTPDFSTPSKTRIVDRQRMLKFLDAGLATSATRFTRQAALAWLTYFPGDLEINLLYAKALMQGKTLSSRGTRDSENFTF